MKLQKLKGVIGVKCQYHLVSKIYRLLTSLQCEAELKLPITPYNSYMLHSDKLDTS